VTKPKEPVKPKPKAEEVTKPIRIVKLEPSVCLACGNGKTGGAPCAACGN